VPETKKINNVKDDTVTKAARGKGGTDPTTRIHRTTSDGKIELKCNHGMLRLR
jgi:hypothetical protein